MNQGGGRYEPYRYSLLASRQTETQRNMALAGATVAERDDILAALDVCRCLR